MVDVLTKIPEFPTPWGEEEEKRLSQLQEQKTRMDELWKTKFSPDAWSRTSPPEKAVRNIMAGQVFEPIARAVSPWQWGFDYGVIPGDFREQMFETEAQYQEMIRMQRVVSVLPSILNTLRALAITNATIVTTKEELDKYFKLTKIGFTDEETAYVVDFARNILRTNLEELASGESLGLKQITAEELESLIGGTRPVLSPTQVLSTVAFSSDLAQIQQALQLAYPPGGGERSTTSGKEMLLQQYLEALRSLGIIQEEGEPLSDAAARAFDKISEGQGWAIPTDEAGVPIIDPNTNEPVIYNIDKDSYVWYGNEVIGFYSAEKNDIVPLSLSGEPILNEEHKERLIVDWFQAAVVDIMNIGYMGRQFIHNTVPMFLRTLARAPFGAVEGEPTVSGSWGTPQQRMGQLPPELEGKPITEEDIPYITAFQEGLVGVNPYDRRLLEIQQDYEADHARRLENYHITMVEFYKENPEYLPRAEWEEPMIDRWKRDKRDILDVGYLGYQMASNMSTYLAMMASIGVTYATKNPSLGLATAMALFTPLQTESLKQDLMDSGATYEQAVGMALPGGILISSIEGVGNIPVQKAVAPQFFRAFRRDLSRGMAAHIGRRFLEYGVKTPIKIITTETFLEEVPQEVLHNLIVQSIDKNRHLLENIPEVVLQTMTTMLPMGVFGGGAQYYNMKRFLRADLLAKLESDSQALQDIGVEKDIAETIAYANLMATETGEAAVWAAKEKMDAEIPHTKWDTYTGEEYTGFTWEEWQDTYASSADFAESISNLEGELTSIATQVEEITSQLEERESRLSKAEIMGNREDIKTQREVVTYLKEQVAELEIRRDKLLASMEQLRQASEQVEVAESIIPEAEVWSREEVTQISPEDIDYAVTSLLEIWSGIPVKERVRLAKKAGLDKKIGSKTGLTNEQAKAIALVRLQEAVAEGEVEAATPQAVAPTVVSVGNKVITAERLTDAERLFYAANVGKIRAHIVAQAMEAGVGTSDIAVDNWLTEQRAKAVGTALDKGLREILIKEVELMEIPEGIITEESSYFVEEGEGTPVTVEGLFEAYFDYSNEALQLLGKILSSNEGYLAKIHSLLRKQFPSGKITVFRGSGFAAKTALTREYTNVTTVKEVAEQFQDVWGGGVENRGVSTFEINVDDVVGIGSVGESELLIRSDSLEKGYKGFEPYDVSKEWGIEPDTAQAELSREEYDNQWAKDHPESISTIPGEPFDFFRASEDLGSWEAAIFYTDESKYYLQRNDGTYLLNPETRTRLFDTVEEIRDLYYQEVAGTTAQAVTPQEGVPTETAKPLPRLTKTTWDRMSKARREQLLEEARPIEKEMFPDKTSILEGRTASASWAEFNYEAKMALMEAYHQQQLRKRAKAETATTPEQVEAIPMPESTQLDLLAQADAWLDQVGKHEPNALHVISTAEGQALVYTDSEGKPMMVVTLPKIEGQLTLSDIVAAKPRMLANGKALIDIINYLEKRDDIAFPSEANMSTAVARLYKKIMAKRAKAETEATSADDTIPPHREELPKKTAWKTEQEQVELAGKLHPEMSEHIVKPKHLRQAQAKAQSEWASLDEKGKAALAKKLELGKTLVAKSWGEMTSIERALLTLNAIPDGSLNFHMRWELADMEEFCEVMEELTGLPFLAIYRRATEVKSVADATKEYILKEIIERPEFYKILKDDLAKARVGQELNARNKIQGVEHPANITQAELELVNLIEYHYNSYKPFVRYMEFMREEANMKALKARFPDAVKEGKVNELALALELRKKGDFTGLWNFLKEATWGVVESGFDPRRISYPDFQFRETAMGTVRGEDSLNRRTKIEFPEGKLEGDVIERFTNYVTQMEIQWHIESELHNFEKLWKLAYRKFNNKNMVKIALNRWWRAMQGIPPEYNWADRIFKKFWRQSMAAIFIEPALSLRNSFQAINLHMDRTELAKVLIKSSLDPVLKIKSKRYFEVMVSQLGGLRKYQQLIGQPGLPGLGPLNRLTDSVKLSALYGWSDYIPRLWSFNAYMNKAWRATQQYLKDGNVANWLKNSGAIHLRDSERNYVLSHFLARASDTFNLQVDTLDAVTGAEMAALYVAQRNTDRTHFKYRRELRGAVEMGPLGETLFNLFVFPRGYAQRLTFQTEKIVNAFRGETSWTEARTGFNDMLGLFIMSQLFSGFWRSLTGRKRNPYDPFGILTQWTFGGLFIGGAVEVTEFLTSLAMIINPYVDEDLKDQAKSRITGQAVDLLELYVPIYKRAIDIVSAVAGTKDQDIYWLRRLREQLDSKYTAPELEELDMNLWEQMKKAILGADPVPPDVFEKAQLQLEEARDMIGTRDITGKYFTLGDYGNLVASVTKGFPDILTSEYAGSHVLDIFYKDCEAQWEEYYLLPTSPTTIRRKWREEHPEEEAMMIFWEKLSSSVFPAGSEGWETVAGLLLIWFNLYKLDKTMHKEWANWGLDLYQEPRR